MVLIPQMWGDRDWDVITRANAREVPILEELSREFQLFKQRIHCPGVSNVFVNVNIDVLGTVEAVKALQSRIDKDFHAARIPASEFAEAIAGRRAWDAMNEIIYKANEGTADVGTRKWNKDRHYDIVKAYIEGLLNRMQFELGTRGSSFTSYNSAVKSFFDDLKAILHDGQLFFNGHSGKHTQEAKSLNSAWIKMWRAILV
jgi:hypothetical protein